MCGCACVHVYMVYEDTNLYNDMGMTQELQGVIDKVIVSSGVSSYCFYCHTFNEKLWSLFLFLG